MSGEQVKTVRDLLLTRRGIVFVSSGGAIQSERLARAVELEAADLGYVFSSRLSGALARRSSVELSQLRTWLIETLEAHVGGRKHVPLFRAFPDGVPYDTDELWWK